MRLVKAWLSCCHCSTQERESALFYLLRTSQHALTRMKTRDKAVEKVTNKRVLTIMATRKNDQNKYDPISERIKNVYGPSFKVTIVTQCGTNWRQKRLNSYQWSRVVSITFRVTCRGSLHLPVTWSAYSILFLNIGRTHKTKTKNVYETRNKVTTGNGRD